MIFYLAAVAILAAQSAAAKADTQGYHQKCEPATYEAWSRNFSEEGEEPSEHDRSNRYCYYDGRGEIAEFRGLNEQNRPYYHGVSITIWNADRSAGRTLWAMVGVDGITDIHQHWDGDVLVTEGEGNDPGGPFIERSTTTFKLGGDYRFSMDRSFDKGESWIAPFNVIEYLRTPTDPPPLPGAWEDNFARFAPDLVGDGGEIILDGYAWGKFIEDDNDQPAGYIFASVAPDDGAWVWRTVTWTFDKGVADVTDVALE